MPVWRCSCGCLEPKEGRVCACGTKISIYNDHHDCAVCHQKRMNRRWYVYERRYETWEEKGSIGKPPEAPVDKRLVKKVLEQEKIGA